MGKKHIVDWFEELAELAEELLPPDPEEGWFTQRQFIAELESLQAEPDPVDENKIYRYLRARVKAGTAERRKLGNTYWYRLLEAES